MSTINFMIHSELLGIKISWYDTYVMTYVSAVLDVISYAYLSNRCAALIQVYFYTSIVLKTLYCEKKPVFDARMHNSVNVKPKILIN